MVDWEWPLIRAVPPACAWHCFRASWLLQSDMVPWCVLTVRLQGGLHTLTKHFQACCHLLFHSFICSVSFTSCGHHQFGSLITSCRDWYLQKALGAERGWKGWDSLPSGSGHLLPWLVYRAQVIRSDTGLLDSWNCETNLTSATDAYQVCKIGVSSAGFLSLILALNLC